MASACVRGGDVPDLMGVCGAFAKYFAVLGKGVESMPC